MAVNVVVAITFPQEDGGGCSNTDELLPRTKNAAVNEENVENWRCSTRSAMAFQGISSQTTGKWSQALPESGVVRNPHRQHGTLDISRLVHFYKHTQQFYVLDIHIELTFVRSPGESPRPHRRRCHCRLHHPPIPHQAASRDFLHESRSSG